MSSTTNNLDHLTSEERRQFEAAMGPRRTIKGWKGVGVLALAVLGCFAMFGVLVASMDRFAPTEKQRMLQDQERAKKKLSIEERVYPEKRS